MRAVNASAVQTDSMTGRSWRLYGRVGGRGGGPATPLRSFPAPGRMLFLLTRRDEGSDDSGAGHQLRVDDPRMAQRTYDLLLRVAVRDAEAVGDCARGEVLVVMEAQHLAFSGAEAVQNAPHDELPLDPVSVRRYREKRDGVQARSLDIVYPHPGPPVGTARVADRADEKGARILDALAGSSQQRQHRVLHQAFAVLFRYVELPGGNDEQEGAVRDVELADVEVGRWA